MITNLAQQGNNFGYNSISTNLERLVGKPIIIA